MDFIIRYAESGDYDALCAICEQGDRIHRANLPHLFRKPDGPAREREYIRSLLEDPNVALLVAEAQGKLVGFINVMLLRSANIPLMVPRQYAVIDNLAVGESYRRYGIGRALMNRAEAWAKEKGAASMELNVYRFNQSAQKLYETIGYEEVSIKMSKRL
jgi:ribosomal protein S18 acetylase RimI-like enzyme